MNFLCSLLTGTLCSGELTQNTQLFTYLLASGVEDVYLHLLPVQHNLLSVRVRLGWFIVLHKLTNTQDTGKSQFLWCSTFVHILDYFQQMQVRVFFTFYLSNYIFGLKKWFYNILLWFSHWCRIPKITVRICLGNTVRDNPFIYKG